MNKEELGIYIHIPFCKQKCYYCDFISFSGIEEKETKYIEAIQKEINSYKFEKYCVTTIYLGGGTPSYLSLESIQEILKNLKEKLKNNEIAWEKIEITIEVNPGTVTKEKLQGYKKAGINRLSIGLQAAQDRLLKQIGRIHTYKEFEQTYNWAKEVGFQNINVDLMLGLPNQSIQDLKESLEKVIANNPTHISTYSLIVEEGAILENKISKGELELPSEELERQMYWYVKNTLELNGYIHYGSLHSWLKDNFNIHINDSFETLRDELLKRNKSIDKERKSDRKAQLTNLRSLPIEDIKSIVSSCDVYSEDMKDDEYDYKAHMIRSILRDRFGISSGVTQSNSELCVTMLRFARSGDRDRFVDDTEEW